MFTGLITSLGKVLKVQQVEQGKVFTIARPHDGSAINKGDSIALDGVCLTAVDVHADYFTVEAVHTTLKKTTLGACNSGDMLNCELALKASDRCGGHVVSGHVEAVGTIEKLALHGNAYDLEISVPTHLMKYMVKEGSIAVDGISLTIADIRDNIVAIAIIPHTWAHTTLQYKKVGSLVNIESDMFAKHFEKYIAAQAIHQAPTTSIRSIEGSSHGAGKKIAIVVASFNSLVTKNLLEGAQHCLVSNNVAKKNILVAHVPGAFEIPLTAQKIAETKQYDAIVCLGAVVRGSTPHFDYVAGEAAKGIATVGLKYGIPVIFGVLTTNTMEEALDRAGGKMGNKGYEAAYVALSMSNLIATISEETSQANAISFSKPTTWPNALL